MSAPAISIRYLRPPDRVQVFEQRLVARLGPADAGPVVTFLPRAGVKEPSVVDGRVTLEPDSPIVWFTFPGRRHDVGRFHLADGTFTGWYANVLEPVLGVEGEDWTTTDLFLDVWLAAGRPTQPRLLDEDELDEALANGWVAPETARSAREEAESLMRAARAGAWPPRAAVEWTLERVRTELGGPA